MSFSSSIDSLKIKAKLLQKAKKKIGISMPLKEAFAKISSVAGYKSWKEMKDSYEIADLLNPPKWSAQWKNWYHTREEALQHFNPSKDFLLPYRNQFFICDEHYIQALGIEMDDKDLKAVGHDWSRPNDQKAWSRLLNKIRPS